MNIKVKVKTVYGADLTYPICDKAIVFCELVNRKTLTDRDIKYIKQLGYEIYYI